MLNFKTGNLLESNELAIVHQANLYHTFGAGIALAIKEKFPYAYKADLETINADEEKLGKFSTGYPPAASNSPFVFNLYSQEDLSPSHTNYNAMYNGLESIRKALQIFGIRSIGIPYGMGCGLADGNWEIVKTIIEQAFDGTDIEVTIYKLPEVTDAK